MAKAAFVLRRFTDAGKGERHPKGSVIKGLSAGEFANYEAGGLVREATDAEASGAKPASEPAAPQSERSIAAPPPEPKPARKKSKKAATTR